jgi:hypothetical protein
MPADLNQLDQQDPMMDPAASPDMGDTSGEVTGLQSGETDREGAMAKADLFKLANYSHKLFGQIQDDQQLEAWVQAKITKAADYIASVYHYLEYEMKFSEYGHHLDNSDTLSEGQKMRLKEMLAEAKDKMKDLKKSQAEKMKEKKVEESMVGGGHTDCHHCGGSGKVYEAPKPVPAHVQSKIDKHKKLHNFIDKKIKDANHNGIPDNEETVDEETSSTGGTITRPKAGVTRHTHNPDRFTDEPHAEPASKAKSKSSAEKAGDKTADKKTTKDSKDYEKRFPGSVTKVVAGKKVDPNAPKEKKEKDEDLDETFGQGVYEAKKKGDGNLANNAKPYDKITRGDVIAGRLGKDEKGGKTMKEAKAKCCCEEKGKTKCPVHKPMNEAERTMSRAAKGYEKYGKAGMMALAKAGREGKDLDKVRDKYDKYDESAATPFDKSQYDGDREEPAGSKSKPHPKGHLNKMLRKKLGEPGKKVDESKPSAGLSAAKKSAVVKDAKAGKDIGKPGKSFDKVAKAAGGGKKGEKIAAAAMWKNMKETTAYMAEKKAIEKKTKEGRDEMADEGNEFSGALATAKAQHKDSFKVDGKTYPVKESSEFTRMQELTGRLNQAEKPALVENREVDQIRALTKKLLG